MLVASDLDRTLIYSSGALALGMPDPQAPRLLCLEVHESKPLSYVTERAADELRALAAETVFVPTTTRTRKQYQRIRLLGGGNADGLAGSGGATPAPAPKYAICANGGHILVDGLSDPDWHAEVLRRVADACAPLAEIRAYLTATTDLSWVRKHRVAEDLFAYLVVERERLPQDWLDRFTAWAGERGWTVSLQGRKVYAVPGPLTKSAAMREVARRTGATLTLAAGDSLLDADLLLAADLAWRPGHGELADSGWTAPHVTALPERGVAAGEEIVRRFRAAARHHTSTGTDGGPTGTDGGPVRTDGGLLLSHGGAATGVSGVRGAPAPDALPDPA
ncbi:HAD family hydrolase [Streptomyces roseicoloratus]|uniref:HAD family hydrolase n=1 Tax=Streptomyces roseicoloratus TaxID=2508722 RepID=A0ABY9S0C7_9ACTN|nr:HAD family hydrolase [Streptomyces roseicoloratus]WMX47266.1 HAD family hydrolase [Streptomyces roseicoloratus]